MTAREEYFMEVRRQNTDLMQKNFLDAQSTEISMVSIYSKKIRELITELEELDIAEKDDDGHFKNIGAYATLIIAINKTHEMLEKLSGTGGAREVMIHMRKAYAKEVAAKSSGMHEAAQKMDVVFMDDAEQMKQFGPGQLPELKKVN